MYKVLFVCTANICRTPMAEYQLAHFIDLEGLPELISVSSCGTWAEKNIPAAKFSQQVCADHGLDISAHRSQPISSHLMNASDLVLCMAEQHKLDIRLVFPHFADKIFTLKEFAATPPIASASISDPYGKRIKEYEKTFEIISAEIRRVFPTIISYAREKSSVE